MTASRARKLDIERVVYPRETRTVQNLLPGLDIYICWMTLLVLICNLSFRKKVGVDFAETFVDLRLR